MSTANHWHHIYIYTLSCAILKCVYAYEKDVGIFTNSYVSFLLLRRCELVLALKGASSPEYQSLQKMHPLTYAALAGVFGAQSVMFAKSTIELLQVTWHGVNQFHYVLTYAILAAMLVSIVVQTHVLSLGLKRFDALYIIPVFTCFYITFSVIGGGVYFQEFHQFTLAQWIIFPIGVLTTITGALIMSRRLMKPAQAPEIGMFELTTVDRKAVPRQEDYGDVNLFHASATENSDDSHDSHVVDYARLSRPRMVV
jgi:hypothetical protein